MNFLTQRETEIIKSTREDLNEERSMIRIFTILQIYDDIINDIKKALGVEFLQVH